MRSRIPWPASEARRNYSSLVPRPTSLLSNIPPLWCTRLTASARFLSSYLSYRRIPTLIPSRSISIRRSPMSCCLNKKRPSKGTTIQTHFDPSLPLVLGDEARLSQVFRNLIKNSLQALRGQRGGVLNISTKMATGFHLVRSPLDRTAPLQPGAFLLLLRRSPHPLRKNNLPTTTTPAVVFCVLFLPITGQGLPQTISPICLPRFLQPKARARAWVYLSANRLLLNTAGPFG